MAPEASEGKILLWTGALLALGALAILVPPLSVPAVVLTLIGALSFPTKAGRLPRAGLVAVGVTSLAVLLGVGRFVLSKGMQGMVTGGQAVATHSGLYKLREIVLAQDAVRKTGAWDPDGDGVGSALPIGVLAGATPVSGSRYLDPPLLNAAFQRPVTTPTGPASRVEGYLFIVCLPSTFGSLTALPKEPVDHESAERRFVAYAWPSNVGEGMRVAFFTDEHERILVLEPAAGEGAPYFGSERAPTCDAALGKDGLPWKPWRNKQPRERLPGDR